MHTINKGAVASTLSDTALHKKGRHRAIRLAASPRISALILSTVLAAGSAGAAAPEGFFDELAKQQARDSLGAAAARLVDTGARVVLPAGSPLAQVNGVEQLYIAFDGRLTGQQRRQLGKAGVKMLRRVAADTYLALVTANGAAALENMSAFRGSEPVLPVDKMSKQLYKKQGIDHAVNDDGSIDTVVKFIPQISLDAAMAALRAVGVQMEAPERFRFGNSIAATLTEGQIAALAAHPSVLLVRQVAGPVQDNNANSAMYSNTDILLDDPVYLLDGSGVTIGMWESGNPRLTHQEYSGRVASEEGSMTDHGTHVAGTILASGVDANARGMAPAAGMLHSYTSAGDPPGEMVTAVSDYGIVISNNSWGRRLGWNQASDGTWSDTGNDGEFGNYTALSQDWDDVVLQTGLVISKSSGNDRNDCDPADATDCDGTQGADGQWYDNMGPRSMAKNIIAVGAVDSAIGTLNDIAGFSSAGPADDGRIKPDIVADGGSLYSSCFANDSDYCNKGGTSMSTPSVTGSTAVLFQHYRNRYAGADPSVEIVKALLVNSAAERGRVGPDYLYGHGMLDALAAAQIIDEGQIRIISGAVDQDEADEYLMLVPGGMDELRVTMTWLDPAGEVSDADHVFQDLDLELQDPAGGIHYPWVGPGTGNLTGLATRTGPNTVDNVEDAEVTNPMQGVWIARVSGTDVSDGAQNYALVANQDFSLPDQPEIEVNFSGNIVGACTGNQIERQIRIFNTGGGDLFVNSVSVSPGVGGNFSILDIPAQPVIVAGGSHIDYTLRYQPQDPTDDTATVVIESNDVDEGVLALNVTGIVGEGALVATLEASGDFGDVMAGTTKVLNLEILNEGDCEGIVADVSRFSGDNAFTVGDLPPGLNLPATLAPGSNFAVPINFSPTVPQAALFGAVIRVEEQTYPGDPTVSNHDLDVVGESSLPVVTISGDGQFGEVCGGDVAERVIQVCNTGPLNTFHAFSANVVQDDSIAACDDFEVVGNPFPADISHDFCMPLTVRYTPSEAGVHSCRLHIITNVPGSGDVFVDLDGETPLGAISALNDLTFTPTVIQEIANAQDRLALPVVNGGACPVEVTAITDDSDHYEAAGVPPLAVELQPGEQLGDGQLEMVFEPLALARELTGTVTVEYVQDPITGATATVSADMCGEGTYTGARVLVTRDGAPVDFVEQIQLLRKSGGNTNGKGKGGKTDSVDVSDNLTLQSHVGSGPVCPSFDYHIEYGTVSNPLQLLPGEYELTVTIPNASGKGKKEKMTQAFSVDVVDFRETIEVAF